MWAAMGTCMDIAHMTSVIAQYMTNPEVQHKTIVKHVICYLKGTGNLGILYAAEDTTLELVGYCNTDYTHNKKDWKSYTSYLFMLAGGPISWESRKQATIATSIMVVEYMAIDATTFEMIWLHNLLKNMRFP